MATSSAHRRQHPLSTIAGVARRSRRSLAAASVVALIAGLTAVFVPTLASFASAGSYSVNWTAADPKVDNAPYLPTYTKKPPSQLACPAPSGGTGVAADPLANAVFGSPRDAVESMAPASLALGQIVPFEMKVTVSGSTAPEGGVIDVTPYWLAKTTSGDDFGYDPAYGLYCAFVDTADAAATDSGTGAKVVSYSSSTVNGGTSNEQIQGTVRISGLDDGDTIIIELWVVLKDTVTAGTSGNVQSGLVSAQTVAAVPDTINTGNQTVPLLRVQEFLTVDADVSVTKSDNPDPVQAGGQLTYTLTVTNNSTDTIANGVVVTDTLDPNTTFVSGTWSGGTCTTALGVVTCNLGALAPGQTVTITVVTSVNANAPTAGTVSTGTCTVGAVGVDLCNRVSVAALTDDPNTANNSDSEPTNVGTATINVVKSSTTTSITAAGQVVPYTFTVTNTGTLTLSGITVTDPNCSAAPAYQSGDANTNSKLETTETWLYTCSHTVTQAEVDAGGNLSNTVTADSTESGPDTDTKNIPVAQNPAINVVKSSTTTSITAAGQVVPYLFTVTNTGNVTLSGVTVTDPNCSAAPSYQSGDANTNSKLETTETWLYTCSHTVTQAEVDAGGNLSNTVTADSTESGPDTDTKNIPVAQNPAINVVKASTTTSITAAGQVVPYTFTVTNTGNVTLSGITVTDPDCDAAPAYQSGDTNTNSKLELTETWLYTCSHTVTQAEVDAGGNLSNTVTADSTESGPDTDTKVIPIAQNASINVVKASTTTSISAAGQVVPYTFTVTNTGNVTLSGVTVTDPNCSAAPAYQSGDTNTNSKLELTETWLYTCSHTVTQAEIDAGGNLTNTVTADSTESAPDTDTKSILVAQTRSLTIDKTATETYYAKVGDVLHYSYLVTNTGNTTLTGLTVNDTKTTVTCPVTTLAPAASTTCTATYTVVAADVTAGSVINIAYAAAGPTQSPTDTVTVPLAELSLDKVAPLDITVVAPTGRADVGDEVDYTLTVTNTGNITLSNVTVTDPTCDTAPAYQSGDTNTNSKLETTETWIYTCSRVLTQADIDAGAVSNTATADSTESEPATDSVRVVIGQLPELQVVKSSTTTSVTAAGQVVPYVFTVTNTGNVTLSGIAVTDPNCAAPPAYQSGDANTNSKLETTETWLYTCSHTVTQAEVDAGGNLSNTVTADSTESGPDTDTKVIPIAQNPLINVVKSSTTTSITAAGQVVPYTFTVTNTGNVTLTGITVTDPKCAVAPAYQSGDINTNSKLELTETWLYTCSHTVTQAEVDAGGNLSNTVTADSTESAPDTDTKVIPIDQSPALSIDKTATESSYSSVGSLLHYSYLVTNTGNVTLSGISVVDNRTTVTCPATTLAPKASMTCTATYRVTQGDLDSGSVTNSAYAKSGSTQSPPDTVTVPGIRAPGLSIVKTATPATYSTVGAKISYSYVVTNTGNVTLGGPFTVADNKAATSCPATAALSPGASITCTATYTITQADLDAGSVTNLATATGGGVTSAPDTATVTADQDPKFTLAKGADPASGSIVQPGTLLTYTITYLNTGNVTLQDKVITDALPAGTGYESIADGGVFDTVTSIASWHTGVVAPGGSKVVHWTVKVLSGLPAGTVIVNVGKIGDVTSNETSNPVASGALTLVKQASSATVEIGGAITYTLAVTATGTLDQTGVVVTDVVPEGASYVVGSAGPAGIASFNDVTNTVTWLVGDLAAGTTVGGLTFTVTALGPPPDPDGSTPPGLIRNVGLVDSDQTPSTPSNTVDTTTPGFFGGSSEPQPVEQPEGGGGPALPFTGGAVPLQLAVLIALTLISVGGLLVAVRRREQGR